MIDSIMATIGNSDWLVQLQPISITNTIAILIPIKTLPSEHNLLEQTWPTTGLEPGTLRCVALYHLSQTDLHEHIMKKAGPT